LRMLLAVVGEDAAQAEEDDDADMDI
jgi:hypothetical protein